jgi:hypothetical protein
MRLKILGVLAAVALLFVPAAGSGTAAAKRGFRLSSIKGSYAGIFSGKASSGVEVLGTGVFVSDGEGGLSGHETFTVDTTVCEATIKGTYTVSPDGTGTDSIDFTATTAGCTSGSYTQSLAIGGSGELILLSNTNGDQINEEWHLQK